MYAELSYARWPIGRLKALGRALITPHPSLATVMGVVFGSTALALVVVLSLVIERTAIRHLETRIGENLAGAAHQLAASLDRDMFERYREIQNTALLPSLREVIPDVEGNRRRLQIVQVTYPYYAWIGFADTQGVVQYATSGLLEGQDVSPKDWFAGSMNNEPFVGDVHEAQLLAKLLPISGDEPLRFVDIAHPVRGQDGQVIGVLGAHLSWAWAQELVARIQNQLNRYGRMDILVLSRKGEILLGPDHLQGTMLEPPDEIRVISKGASKPRMVTWGQEQYVVSLANTDSYGWVGGG